MNKRLASKGNSTRKSVATGISVGDEASRTENPPERRPTGRPGLTTDDSRPYHDTFQARTPLSEQTSTSPQHDPTPSTHNPSSSPCPILEQMDIPTSPSAARDSPAALKSPPSVSGSIRHPPPVSSLIPSIGQTVRRSQRSSTVVAKHAATVFQRGKPPITPDATLNRVNTWKGDMNVASSKTKRDSDAPKYFSPTVTENSVSNPATVVSASTTPTALASIRSGKNVWPTSTGDLKQEQHPGVLPVNALEPISRERPSDHGRNAAHIVHPAAEVLQTPPSEAPFTLPPPVQKEEDFPRASPIIPCSEMSPLYCDTPLDAALPRYPPSSIIIPPQPLNPVPSQNCPAVASSSDPALSLPASRSLSPRHKSARSVLDDVIARLPMQSPPVRTPKLLELPPLARWFKNGEMKPIPPNERPPGRTKPRAKPFTGKSAGWSFIGSHGKS